MFHRDPKKNYQTTCSPIAPAAWLLTWEPVASRNIMTIKLFGFSLSVYLSLHCWPFLCPSPWGAVRIRPLAWLDENNPELLPTVHRVTKPWQRCHTPNFCELPSHRHRLPCWRKVSWALIVLWFEHLKNEKPTVWKQLDQASESNFEGFPVWSAEREQASKHSNQYIITQL